MQGSCKCGVIQFRTGVMLQLVNCHCQLCRSMNGAAYSSYAVTRSVDFVMEHGAESLATFTAAGHAAAKHFCRHCGTPVFNLNARFYPGLTMVYLGALRDHTDLLPGINVFCSSRLAWTDDLKVLPQFADAPRRA